MPGKMIELSQEFNATARAYQAGGMPAQIVATKYNVLANHRAETPEEKKVLARTLFNCAVQWLTACGQIDGEKPYNGVTDTLKTLLNPLAGPDRLHLLPENASDQLAECALGILRRVERGKGLEQYQKEHGASLATLVLEFADNIAAHRTAAAPAAPTPETTAPKKDDSLRL